MPVSELLKSPFIPRKYYHLVFKSIGGLILFNNNMDYTVFIERFSQFNGLVFDTWAYCLLNNHAHFIIKVKTLDIVLDNIVTTNIEKQTVAMKKLIVSPDDAKFFDEMVERQVNSFMVSYCNYIKNRYHHHGGLFQKPFKRIQIDTDAYLQMAIIYVHANPVKHKICNNYKTYRYSSFHAILEEKDIVISSAEVTKFFGDTDKFILLHDEQINYYYQKGFPKSKLE